MPARIYLWISVAYLLVLGIGSLIVNPNFSVGDQAKGGHLFGLIETNGWHGIAGVLLGSTALCFALSQRWAREGAALVGLFSLASGVLLLLYGDGAVALWLVPADTTDAILLHILPGVAGVLCSAATPGAPLLQRREAA